MAPTSPGWEYTSTLQLDIKDVLVTGSNLWKVVESPGFPWAGKTAKEFLSGEYNRETRVVEVEGTSKDDPEGVIALDAYRLTLSEDGTSLSGYTRNEGSWEVSTTMNLVISPKFMPETVGKRSAETNISDSRSDDPCDSMSREFTKRGGLLYRQGNGLRSSTAPVRDAVPHSRAADRGPRSHHHPRVLRLGARLKGVTRWQPLALAGQR